MDGGIARINLKTVHSFLFSLQISRPVNGYDALVDNAKASQDGVIGTFLIKIMSN